MAINKFMDKAGKVLLDLSNDTVSAGDVAYGKTFHDRSGKFRVGTMAPLEAQEGYVDFYDYDGTLLYSWTEAQLNAATELPALPNREDENLTCEGWNWTLDELKDLGREMNVGCTYHTTDDYTYLYMDFFKPGTSFSLSIKAESGDLDIDWGDGTTGTSTSHTYENAGEYVIKFKSNNTVSITGVLFSSIEARMSLIRCKLSNQITSLGRETFHSNASLESINLTNKITTIMNYTLSNCPLLKFIVFPRSLENFEHYALSKCSNLRGVVFNPQCTSWAADDVFRYCYSLSILRLPNITYTGRYAFSSTGIKNIYIPGPWISTSPTSPFDGTSLKKAVIGEGATILPASLFSSKSLLEEVILPYGLTTINSSVFYSTQSLKYIKIPSSVTSIGSSAFGYSDVHIVDLSTLENPPALGSSFISTFNSNNYKGVRILIAPGTKQLYLDATNWSTAEEWRFVEVEEEENA